jgi:hypothetical protein
MDVIGCNLAMIVYFMEVVFVHIIKSKKDLEVLPIENVHLKNIKVNSGKDIS